MTELEAAIAAKFQHLSLAQLIERIERAPAFGYDDESVELNRRLAASDHRWRWGPGDRVIVEPIPTLVPDLLEDEDGAPLPPELQRDGAVWAAIRAGIETARPGHTDDEVADSVAVALAPVLWPWLPSNDHGAPATLARVQLPDWRTFGCETACSWTGTTCAVCAGPIAVGDPMRANGRLVVHARCFAWLTLRPAHTTDQETR